MNTQTRPVFKKATLLDLNEIYEMFSSAVEAMEIECIFQWDDIYPDKAVLSDDISKGQMFIGILNGEICSAFVINKEYDDEYGNGNWNYSGDNFKIIHRLCVNPKYQNIGIGKMTMNYIENKLAKSGVASVRLDVFSENPHAIRLYKGLGYNAVGTALWRKGIFYLMEKIL